MKKIVTSLVIVISAGLLVSCSTAHTPESNPQTPPPSNTVGSAGEDSNFADPISAFTLSPQEYTFESGDEEKTFSVSTSDTAVYAQAFYRAGGEWQPVNLSGSSKVQGWVIGDATGSFTLSGADAQGTDGIDVVTYTCTWLADAEEWDCHGMKWQRKQLSASLVSCEANQCRCVKDACEKMCYDANEAFNGSLCVEGEWAPLPGGPGNLQ